MRTSSMRIKYVGKEKSTLIKAVIKIGTLNIIKLVKFCLYLRPQNISFIVYI